MKKFFIVIYFLCLATFAQEKNRVFVNYGLTIYPYMIENKKNFVISTSFYHQTKKEKWAMEYYFLYSQNDNFPSFYNDEKVLQSYLLNSNPETILEDTKWNSVENYEIGTKVHYLLYRKNRVNLSCNFGIGIRTYDDKLFRVLSFKENQDIIIVSSYEFKGGGYSAALFPGLHFDYDIGNMLLLTFNSGFHMDVNPHQKVNENDGTFWNFSVGIGKKF